MAPAQADKAAVGRSDEQRVSGKRRSVGGQTARQPTVDHFRPGAKTEWLSYPTNPNERKGNANVFRYTAF